MKIYLVGGAVRDELLGVDIKDRDYVVVGSSPQEMIAAGFIPIEATSFPVFLHPKTGEEYALARKERKTGEGYHGFDVNYDSSISLEEDLFRRDLTINAMAKNTTTGEIIDPFGGQRDLNAKLLRHVSTHFVEDPLRVIRVARFAARYDFTVSPDTISLCCSIVNDGELDFLPAERIWKETERALMEAHPNRYVDTLRITGALEELLPEIANAGRSYKFGNDLFCRVLAMIRPASTYDIEGMLNRINAPNNVIRIVQGAHHLVTKWPYVAYANEVVEELEAAGAYRDVAIFNTAVMFMKLNNEMVDALALERAYELTKPIGFADLTSEQQSTLKGVEIGNAIRTKRIETMGTCKA